MNRRRFLKTLLGVGAATVVTPAGGYLYARYVEPERLTIERTLIPIPGLPSALDGFKIVQMSDFHLFPFTEIALISEAVAKANELKPDLIVLTGDYVLGDPNAIFELAPVLAGLNGRQGVFAILGNHDWWTNVKAVKLGFAEAGLTVLQNQGMALGEGRDNLYLAGVDDCWSGKPDFEAAMADHPAGATTILLAHEPDFADTFAQDGRLALQLSGHSHGGQVRLPGVGALVLPSYGQRYDMGLNRVGQMWVYTTRGIGVVGPPVRLNCPPEISELILTRS